MKAATKTKKQPRLPRKISRLIELALADLRKCEADQDYVVDMDRWHIKFAGECHVCLAGAVMAQTFKIPKERACGIGGAGGSYIAEMYALDDLRLGRCASAWAILGRRGACPVRDRAVVDYTADPVKFRRQMTSLAVSFRKAGD